MSMCLPFLSLMICVRRDAPNKIIVFTIQKVTSGNIAVTIYRYYQNISRIYMSLERSRTLTQIIIHMGTK